MMKFIRLTLSPLSSGPLIITSTVGKTSVFHPHCNSTSSHTFTDQSLGTNWNYGLLIPRVNCHNHIFTSGLKNLSVFLALDLN